jgi:hypothetical protein
MQFSKVLSSLALLSSVFSATIPKRDTNNDDDVVIVHLTTTVHQVQTDYTTFNGVIVTNDVTAISTTTVTSYTATVTSTIFGTPYTFTTVAPTPIDTAHVSIPSSIVNTKKTSVNTPETTSLSNPTTLKISSLPATEKVDTAETTTTPTTTTSTNQVLPSSTNSPTTSTQYVDANTNSDGPTITGAIIPTSTGQWIIDNVVTTTSDGVCYVDYDYYDINDPEETTTITSTVYTTVTQT